MIIAVQTLVYFRESLIGAVARIVSPYYLQIKRSLTNIGEESDEEDEDEVFAEFDEEKGVVFFPPMYIQRYAAVSDCILDDRWKGKLEKIVDLGYHDMSFIKYLKDLPGVKHILGVDLESIPLKCSSDLLASDNSSKRESPLQVTLFQGNAADPDYRLIGCDAVVAIEMIEHMLPHDLDRLVHNIFGFIQPWIAVITTPNGDFNVLFKAMEKNGLRRLDHFFEWSREQFNDWCSNIVTRYPQFSVHCQGIGPGPPGTAHHGCCSQMALFVNKCYVKRQDMDINSLALVPKIPTPDDCYSDISGYDTPPRKMICPLNQNSDSLNNLISSQESFITILITSALSAPSSLPSLMEYRDQTSQCNIDLEAGKSFMMFDSEETLGLPVLVPRRRSDVYVYQIEDVNSRLNCSTLQVTKFSKTTQNLIAKNKIDVLAHTRDVVKEIRQLTDILNWKRETQVAKQNGLIWYNINWGEDAPYWNQYYTVVRRFDYPFEVKSEESLMLDLISEEINRLIDTQPDRNVEGCVNVVQIPLEHLMNVVSHVTNNVDKVRDVLEWNGYEIVDNMVVYSRMSVDNRSLASADVDWPRDDTSSELETVRSSTATSITSRPVNYGLALRQAIDIKMKNIREMLSADEDITTELDRIVCRLMKLALRSSSGRAAPPRSKWMECKLFELLALTENAVSRRREWYLENQPKKSVWVDNTQELTTLLKLRGSLESTAGKLVEKYEMLIESIDKNIDPHELHFEDEMGDEFDSIESAKDNYLCCSNSTSVVYNEENSQPYDKLVFSLENNINEESNKSLRPVEVIQGKSNNKHKYLSTNADAVGNSRKNSKTNVKVYRNIKTTSNTVLRKQAKKVNKELGIYGTKTRILSKEHRRLHPTASKPIPKSIIDLCHPELGSTVAPKMYNNQARLKYREYISKKTRPRKKFATEESFLCEITMGHLENKVDIQRSLNNDLIDSVNHHQEAGLEKTSSNTEEDPKLLDSNENNESQTIFLNDINEPSTSKGIRHLNMDAQCGTDVPLSTNGITNVISACPHNYFSDGVRIDSLTNVTSKINDVNIGTSDFDATSCKTKVLLSKGIKIGDSLENVTTDERNLDISVFNEDGTDVSHEKYSVTNITRTLDGVATKKYELNSEDKYSLFKRFNPNTSTKNIRSEPDAKKRRINSPKINMVSKNADNQNSNISSSIAPVHKGFSFTKPNDSMTNFLINFKQITGFQSRTIDLCQPRSITNTDSMTHVPDGAAEHNAINDEDWLKHRPEPIISGDTNVDVINDVFFGKNTDMQIKIFTPPELCKPVQSRATEFEKSEFVFEVPNSFTLPLCKDFIATSTEENTAKENQHSLGLGKPTVSILGRYDGGFVSINSGTEKNRSYSSVKQEQDNEHASPEPTLVFNINDHNYNVVEKVEFSTNRVESLCAVQVYVPPSSMYPDILSKEEAINQESTEDSVLVNVSNENESISVPKEFVLPSSLKLHRSICEECGVQNKISLGVASKLSCACVHIHSYKQTLQDIVYQGEWKQHVEKREFPGNTVVAKKISQVPPRKTRSVSPRIRMNSFQFGKTVEIEPKKPGQAPTQKPTKAKKVVDKTAQHIRQNVYPKIALKKAIKKVSSKTMIDKMKINNNCTAPKNNKPVRLMKNTLNVVQVIKNDTRRSTKNLHLDNKYLPKYLRRLKLVHGNPNLDTSSDSGKTRIIKSKIEKKKFLSPNSYGDTKSTILKMKPRKLNYTVFRNEIEMNSSTAQSSRPAGGIDAEDVNSKKVNLLVRSSSPLSQKSSTGSTADSVLTVKLNVDKPSNKRKPQSNKCGSDTEASSSINLNKIVRNNNIKQMNGREIANKENIAQSSNKCGMGKNSRHFVKGTFTKQNKIYVAQIPEGNRCGKKPIATESHLKLSPKECGEAKKNLQTPVVLRRKSAQSNDISVNESKEPSNVVLLVERKSVKDKEDSVVIEKISRTAHQDQEAVKLVESERILSWIDSGNTNSREIEITESSILASMRQIVEERLNFIGCSLTEVTNHSNVDSFDDNSSFRSFKTVVTVDDSKHHETLKSDIGNVMTDSSDTMLSVVPRSSSPKESSEITILECLSFNSVTSVSKYSSYFSADSEGNQEDNSNITCGQESACSCYDIFERADSTSIQGSPRNFASQVFSDCSMQEETMIGDQLHFSISEVTSQETSEEMDTSGRSASTYEEQVQQGPDPVNLVDSETGSLVEGYERLPIAEDDDEQQEPMPPIQPQFDVNGNVMEPIQGLGTGAGDGRGIHSDRSQDSSGRGSSLSSSNDSSGQQSQAILIDPSAFTNQYVLVHEPIGSSMAITTLIVPVGPSERNGQANETLAIVGRNETLQIVTAQASDGEADISSTDTDIRDSS